MERDDLVYAGHMLDMACKALVLVSGKTREEFDRDEVVGLVTADLAPLIAELSKSFPVR